MPNIGAKCKIWVHSGIFYSVCWLRLWLGNQLLWKEKWRVTLRKWKVFFTVSKAKNGHKLHALVAGLPADAYLVLRDMCGTEMPSENRYDVLIKLVKYHYDSSSKTILERKIFRLIKRKLEKKIHAYMVRLSRAARGCQFKGNVNKNLVCLEEELITLTLHHALWE